MIDTMLNKRLLENVASKPFDAATSIGFTT